MIVDVENVKWFSNELTDITNELMINCKMIKECDLSITTLKKNIERYESKINTNMKLYDAYTMFIVRDEEDEVTKGFNAMIEAYRSCKEELSKKEKTYA